MTKYKETIYILLIPTVALVCWYNWYTKEINDITCTTPLVTIYDIDKTKAKFHLTCTDEQGNIIVNETLNGVQVGYIAHKENKRVLGMKGRSMEQFTTSS